MYGTIRRRARTGRKYKRFVFTVDAIERKFRVRFVSHDLIDKKKKNLAKVQHAVAENRLF